MLSVVITSYRDEKGCYLTVAAVQAQQNYAKHKGIPWGMSESAFYAFDSSAHYQYRAFGLPALAFKQGVENDLVVAPYASVLGVGFDPAAVAKNFDTYGLGDKAHRLPVSEVINNYQRSEVIDPLTVKFYFNKPSPGFLQGTATIGSGLVSLSTLQRNFEELGDARHIIGSGPFVVQDEKPGRELTLVARKDYQWGPKNIAQQGPANLDGITYIVTPEDSVRIGALLALRGVQWPMASVILHFAFPDRYPILDVRAMNTVGGSTLYTFERWLEYLELCRATAKTHGITMRTLDKALWAFDKGSP